MKKAFTMIELIMIIVILGILSVAALPNFFNMNYKGEVAKLKSEYSSINASVKAEYLRKLIIGESGSYDDLGTSKDMFFTNIFKDGIKKGKYNKAWAELKISMPAVGGSHAGLYFKNGATPMPTAYDPITDNKEYFDLAYKNGGFNAGDILRVYRYTLDEGTYYNFIYRNTTGKFECAKAVCIGCGLKKRNYINRTIDCVKRAS